MDINEASAEELEKAFQVGFEDKMVETCEVPV
jgi:hypothetical protein